jgi:hypothetical protein
MNLTTDDRQLATKVAAFRLSSFVRRQFTHAYAATGSLCAARLRST